MKKILIVDDLPEIAELVELTIKIRDFKILRASNGPDALEIAKREKPNLILLDIMMPEGGMDGFEVCGKLKGDPETRSAVVILLTSLKEEAAKLQGFRAGADGYFTKPFSPLSLIQKIDEILSDETEGMKRKPV